MKPLQVLKWLFAALFCAIYLSQFYVTLFKKTSRGDLALVLDAATRMRSAELVYDTAEYHTHTKPPLTTLAFVPLSILPRFYAERVWDLLTLFAIAGCIGWTLSVLPKSAGVSKSAVGFLAFCCTFNSFNAELIFGQFNVLLLLAAMAAVFSSKMIPAGAAYAFSLFFKPTQVVFAPPILKARSQRVAFWKFGAGGIAAMALLALAYGLFLGWDRLVSDHLAWWAKAGGVTPIHVARDDNNGLPSLLASWGMAPGRWWLFQLAGIAFAFFVSLKIKDKFASFALIAAATVVCSPMAWRYVYVLAFPLICWMWAECLAGRSRKVLGFGIAAYFWGTQFYNPELLKVPLLAALFPDRPPLWGLLVAMFSALWVTLKPSK